MSVTVVSHGGNKDQMTELRPKIDKNIPIRPRVIYPWAEMEVGDSFLIPALDDREMRAVSGSAHSSAAIRSLTIRTGREPGGVRVWLTSRSPKKAA